MTRVTWAAIATRTPMGQQVYERQIKRALTDTAGPEWEFRDAAVSSMRSDIPGVRKVPIGLYQRSGLGLARLLGAYGYGTKGLVHRFDLRIPPGHREVVTIHDLPPRRFPDEGTMPNSAAEGARRSRVVITPTRFAAAEVIELLGVDESRVRVIPYGLSEQYVAPSPAQDSTLTELGINGPFVIHAAGATLRKNLAGLAAAWRHVAAAHRDVTLVLCGPEDSRRNTLFDSLPNVRMTGRLPAETVAGLMCRSEAVVVPSTYEGFGLPAMEGMACARPVVAARAGALPEVCADAAILVEPDGESLAAGIESALTDTDLRARLAVDGPKRAASFSWEVAARAHLDAYRVALR